MSDVFSTTVKHSVGGNKFKLTANHFCTDILVNAVTASKDVKSDESVQ